MTREERCKLAIERGFTYNSETGLIYNRYNKISSSINNNGYIQLGVTLNKNTYMFLGHQFAWYYVYKECVNQIDHINNNKIDNRICNLRSVTNQQNSFNRSKVKGYYWFKRDRKWKSKIYVNNKEIHLGTYNTEEEARNAYLQAKEIYHKF